MESVQNADARPRLLFLRPESDGLPPFIARHLQEHVDCLRQHFDVVIAPTSGDYKALCEQHRPALAMFESGVYAKKASELRNTDAYPEVPKLGFLDADAYCLSRSTFMSDMARWGVEHFCTLSVSMPEYFPEIADRLFIWANSINPAVYRDFGLEKNVPVLFTGSQATHYPWRNRIRDALSLAYPVLTYPHFGWFDKGKSGRMAHGEAYARIINAAHLAPACGTIAKEVVRKHFEIPGCRTCLVAEETDALAAAGFVDMENCVFANPDNVLDRVEKLASDRDLLRHVTDGGYRLVHDRHTWKNRDQVFQWFSLLRNLQSGERIVQLGPFDGLVAVDRESRLVHAHVHSGGVDRALLREAERRLAAGACDRAEELFLRCLNYHPSTPEPYVGLARCCLERGDAAGAHDWVRRIINMARHFHHPVDPDPVEWAYLILALLCLGKVEDAARRATEFPDLHHPFLARCRRLPAMLDPRASRSDGTRRSGTSAWQRPSVHRLPEQSETAWIDHVARLLRRCRQGAIAERMQQAAAQATSRVDAPVGSVAAAPPPNAGTVEAIPQLRDAGAGSRLRGLARRLRRHALRTIADPGYPVGLLASRRGAGDYASLAGRFAGDGRVASVLFISPRAWSPVADTLVANAERSPALPTVLYVARPRTVRLWQQPPTRVRLRAVSASDLAAGMRELGIRRFDLAVIEGPAPIDEVLRREVLDAEVILMDHLDSRPSHALARELRQGGSGYRIVTSQLDRHGGFAAFQRLPETASRGMVLGDALAAVTE